MTGIFEELKWKIIQLRKRGRIIGTYYCKKVCEVKPKFMQMTLSKIDVAEINTQWLIRLVMQVKTPRRSIRKTSHPELSGTGITSPILSSPLLNCQTTAYQNSLPFCELGTNPPLPSPYEILPFWRFISKLF